MAVIGFDFGTTNSLISIIQGNKPVNLLDDRGLPFPSVVCYEGGKKIIGQEAKEKLSHAGLGVHGNIVRSPKMLLGKESVDIEGVARNPVDIAADVVSFVKSKVTFIKNRLACAKSFLREDGFIVIAIDHAELFYLGVLADEVFGEENRISIITVEHNPKGRNQAEFVSDNSEFLLV